MALHSKSLHAKPKALPPVEQPTMPGADMTHITQEMYKQNLQLSERNKTLTLLRRIDESVLRDIKDLGQIAEKITGAIVVDSEYNFADLLVKEKNKRQLLSQGRFARSPENREYIDHLDELGQSYKWLDEVVFAESPTKERALVVYQLQQIYSRASDETAKKVTERTHLKTIFVNPIAVEDQIVGTLILGTYLEQKDLSEFQKDLIERLTNVIGIALNSALLYEQTQSMNKRLQQLDKAKDEFISMASHQLRTPLTTVKGYLSMMLEGDVGEMNENQTKYIDLAYRSADAMAYTITDLLNVSRVNTGKLIYEKVPMSFEEVAEEQIKQLKRHADSKNVKLEYHAPEQKLPRVLLDAGKMRQVMMNFMDNAAYYAPNTTVDVYLEHKNGNIVFRVVDHGIGVPKEDQKKLFTKFFRAGNAKVARPDGTGLGIFMAKKVVEDQGGSVIFHSEEGQGSTFGFQFPLSKIVLEDQAEGQSEQA